MIVLQFLMFVIAILLFLIFWELSRINSRLGKTLAAKGELPPVANSTAPLAQR